MQYRIGQLYMVAKFSRINTKGSEGVQLIKNEEYVDPVHGKGQYTEKRVYLGRSLMSHLHFLRQFRFVCALE